MGKWTEAAKLNSKRKRRNAKVAALYATGDYTQRQIAELMGLGRGHVSEILRAARAVVPGVAFANRSKASRARWDSGRFDSAKMGRPKVWPDVPPELEPEYDRFRKLYQIPAAEARAMLERKAA